MNHSIILAPMHGVTDYIYRNVYHAHFPGIDLAISPFINALPDEKLKKSQVKGVLPENNKGMPLIPQILGSDVDDFIFLAKHLHGMGYESVNWNLGCPYRMVVKRKRGAGILPHPELIAEFLDKVMPAIPMKLSVKLRLGLNDADEIDAIIPILNQYPIDEVTIHPRLGVQMYDGSVDLDAFEKFHSAFNMPVVYNGDIVAVSDFKTLKERFPNISRWMIGRGVIRNPWLPALIKGKEVEEQEQLDGFIQFHDALYDAFSEVFAGPGHLINKMKEYWMNFSLSFDDSRKVFKKIKKVNSLAKYQYATQEIFQNFTWAPGK